MPRFSLLIFDWDGTLADSAGHIVNSMQQAISALNLPPRPDQAIRELIGLGPMDAMSRLFPELPVDEVLRLLAEHRRSAPTNLAPEAPLFGGAHAALTRLRGEGYLLAVATGKYRMGLNRSFSAHPFLQPMFSATRCADESADKPDPLMLRQILDQTGVRAEQALMVGDTEFDIAMARALNMPAVGVSCGVHDAGRLLRAGAHAVLENVSGLPNWLSAPR
ncbi:MAG TPA: HAD-IA family hydrolase [Nevskia sp.]|jgi:phosphoglycolate phosphatase|nr:HAD-IA family hydrolase [Nevskia sp.]